MQPEPPRWLLLTFAVSATLALVGMDQSVALLRGVFKPLTTLLLFAVLGTADTSLRRKIRLGLCFSLVGDVALLSAHPGAFMLGLASFLCAHIAYITAFLSVGKHSSRPWLTLAVVLPSSACTVYLAWPFAAQQGVALPVAVYGLVLTGMVVSAASTIGGPLLRPRRAAWGALLFYIADTALAFDVFVPSIELPHASLLTCGVYWIGQLGIMQAARAGVAVQTNH